MWCGGSVEYCVFVRVCVYVGCILSAGTGMGGTIYCISGLTAYVGRVSRR